ncbi:hypothetical protein NC661_07965 [Aquibacillus koreensis]|uniref:Uncharacterized protein n=1 Tax=Aquibacillus koreensis TaxID=279446 RepID=A0A9X3WK09_9BACI|nr:hypothetical protein [Aquibacillus koreensis]MCT2535842.1 hypothetical protein [Aquibacillus koreensis]MDC3420298.1 hypothetical protein [Aquibacillus koreensis]
MKKYQVIVGTISLFAIITLLFVSNTFHFGEVSAKRSYTAHLTNSATSQTLHKDGIKIEENANNQSIDHETVVSLTGKFMHLLVQETNMDNNKVVQHDTKASLLEAFTAVATKEVAKKYIDFYYEEKQDGLYIIPTETPPWFEKETNYEKIEIDPSTVKIKQENETELYGQYSIEFILQDTGDGWIITEINHL